MKKAAEDAAFFFFMQDLRGGATAGCGHPALRTVSVPFVGRHDYMPPRRMPSCMGCFVRFVKYAPKILVSFVIIDTLH